MKKFTSLLLISVLLTLTLSPLTSAQTGETELTELRTLNSKTYDLGNGERKGIFYEDPIHYLENDQYKEIDINLEKSTNQEYPYQVEKGIYKAYFPKTYNNYSVLTYDEGKVFISNNQLELIKADTATPLYTATETEIEANKNSAIYKKAFAENIDAELNYDNKRFIRKVIFNSKENLELENDYDYLGYSFEVKVPEDTEIYIAGQKWIDEEVTTDEDIEFKAKDETLFYFSSPYSIDNDQNRQKLSFEVEKTYYNTYKITKLIPKSWLETASYPLYADDTLEAFAVVDFEASNSNADYATARNASTGTLDTSSTLVEVGQWNNTGTYEIYRYKVYFDTSSIGADSTVTAATLSLFSGVLPSSSGWSINVYSWLENTPPTIGADDYDQTSFGSTLFGSIARSSYNAAQYNDITLTNFDGIIKTSNTYLGLRSSDDVASTAPTAQETVTITTSNNPGTTQDPKLTVTYSQSIPEYSDYTYIILLMVGFGLIMLVTRKNKVTTA